MLQSFTNTRFLKYILSGIFLIAFNTLFAQTKTDTTFKAGGKLWGLAFGDFYYKAHADTLNRGSNTQYSGVPKDRNAFQIRRLYLGYNYNITKKFDAEVLMEAAPGEGLTDSKLAFYIKLANVRIKDLWRGTDLVVGQISTLSFSKSSESIWGYRSIEKTITDMHGTPSYDLGVALQGKFDPGNGNFGYDLMVGNGTGAKPEGDNYKWFYGDVWGRFFDKKLYLNLYADYNRLNPVRGFEHSRSMIKGVAAYTTPGFTLGVEAFSNHLQNDNEATQINTGNVDVLTVNATGLSIFTHAPIVKDKLQFFARFDAFNPGNEIDNGKYNKYVANTSGYNDASTKDQFISAGLDFTPAKNVHFMPNVWYYHYSNKISKDLDNGFDLVYRATFYYVFGK